MANKLAGSGAWRPRFNADYAFIHRDGHKATRDQPESGRAYAFFDCNASPEEISRELPTIRQYARTPEKLELALTRGVNPQKFRGELRQIAQDARDAGIKYNAQARLPNHTNEQTANEVADILNQAYQSPLYRDGEPFRGEIFYEKDGTYVTRN